MDTDNAAKELDFERSGPRGLKSAIATDMSSQQTPASALEAPAARSEGSLDGGLFVAGVAIGVAPAAAAAGIMLNSSLLGFGVTGALLLLGFVTAAVSTEL